jgi:serine/threonine-protein kinase
VASEKTIQPGRPTGQAPDTGPKDSITTAPDRGRKVLSSTPSRERPLVSSLPPVGLGESSPLMLPAICDYGRFELLGRLAFGGMAEIFLAREPSTVGAARLIAIKRILPRVADDPQFVRMFLDEARLAVQLQHPSICHLYEFGELEGTYFIAMEWIHGAQLGKIIRAARAHGGIAPELAARVISQIAEALHYAHRLRDSSGAPLGIVHRDVSPHNIMVSYDGHVKLLDFGIAKATSQEVKTEAGVVKGKFAYMAPEQCLGRPIDARADVFALGICLYEILAGETLYVRATDYETMHAVLEDSVPSAASVRKQLPPELDAIVAKALAKDPEERFKSAGAMQTALDDWQAKRGVTVNARSLAVLMAKLFADQIRAGPLVDSTPFGNSVLQRAPTPEHPGAAQPESHEDPATRVGAGSTAKVPDWGSLVPPAGESPGEVFRETPAERLANTDGPLDVLERDLPTEGAPRPAERPPAPSMLEAAHASLHPRSAPLPSLELAFEPRKPAIQRQRPSRLRSDPAPADWRARFAALPVAVRLTIGLLAVVVALGVAGIAYRAIARAVAAEQGTLSD